MSAQILMPHQQPQMDPLEKLATAVGIARQIYGIHADSTNLDLARQQKEEQAKLTGLQAQGIEDQQKGVVTNAELLKNGLGDFSKDAKAGYVPVLIRQQDGSVLQQYVKPKSGESALGDMLKGLDIKNKEADLAKKNRDLNAEKKGKPIPATELVSFGSADAAQNALDGALKSINDNQDIVGPFQGKLSNLAAYGEFGDTGKRAKALNAQLKTNAQIIGKSLEGGKLTDQDILRYQSMLPNLNDSPEAAGQKTEVLKNMIAQKRAAEVSSLQKGGYDIGQLGMPATQVSAPQQASGDGADHSLDALLAEKARRKQKNATASK
jgi:hypothetical protein